jgi:hypothetical protein
LSSKDSSFGEWGNIIWIKLSKISTLLISIFSWVDKDASPSFTWIFEVKTLPEGDSMNRSISYTKYW